LEGGEIGLEWVSPTFPIFWRRICEENLKPKTMGFGDNFKYTTSATGFLGLPPQTSPFLGG